MRNTTTSCATPNPTSPQHKNNVNVFPIAFGVAIGALSVISIVLVASYLCSKKRAPLRRTGSVSSSNEDSITIEMGLDEATLNSYPKLVYSQTENDENTPEDDNEEKVIITNSCSICLQEYKGSDVVRMVPECEHMYHVHCIDTWLKVHRTCPVCRSSQLPGPESAANQQRLNHGPWFVQMMR